MPNQTGATRGEGTLDRIGQAYPSGFVPLHDPGGGSAEEKAALLDYIERIGVPVAWEPSAGENRQGVSPPSARHGIPKFVGVRVDRDGSQPLYAEDLVNTWPQAVVPYVPVWAQRIVEATPSRSAQRRKALRLGLQDLDFREATEASFGLGGYPALAQYLHWHLR